MEQLIICYIDFLIKALLIVACFSAAVYVLAINFGHYLPTKINYRLQDVSFVGIFFMFLALILAAIQALL